MTDLAIIPNWLMQRAYLTPERIGLETKENALTFKEMHEMALKRAGALMSFGVKKGDRVAILMKNSSEMVHMIHAVFYCGGAAVLLNTRLSASEMHYQIKDSGAALLITGAEFSGQVQEMDIKTFTAVQAEPIFRLPVEFETEFDLAETAVIMYTSGTTGKPKGVMQTFGNHYWSAVGSALNLGLHTEDKWLAAVPLFHISGLSILFRSVIYGITVQLHEQFDAKTVNQSILKEKVSIVSAVSTMLAALVQDLNGGTYPETFRCMLLGGGPAPASLLSRCKDKNIPVFQTYGMTETSSQFATLPPEYALQKSGSAGKPLFPCRIKVVDGSGDEAGVNVPGEIMVKGPNVMKGYWNNEEATRKAMHQGWLKTGDIGRIDEEGFLFMMDRRSDLIISGGENIYPAEIESVLQEHPLVLEAGVTGVADDRWGQVPHAYVAVSQDISGNELLQFCSERLAKYKVPKKIIFTDALPRNASRKLQRHLLKGKEL
ncbi:o-succinylbenzoate--CoA ligase [Metabacillus sp. 84]|uniref:o-succinylbenzoate--CoA ligase n=1 Tax=unclassified Metabacillus TaxID=2675274 RepID=UPI003CE9DE5B